MSDEKKFHSAFKRIRVSKDGGDKIKQLQDEFELFWKKVHKYGDKGHEKYYALKAIQECCMWLTRSCAVKYYEESPKVIIDDPLNKEHRKPYPHQQNIADTLARYKDGDVIKNNPRIIVKKKKV